MITKKTTDLTDLNFSAGEVFLVDKDFGQTSFSAVYKVRKLVKVKKVGHAGTLDPHATGLLIICCGKKTKEISRFQDLKKTYTGIITIGKKTPSMDNETEVTEEHSIDGITENEVLKIRDEFLGTITQTPPMFSAIKHKGKALYKYARKGVEVKRVPREVTIYSFDITKIDFPEIHFEIKCSKGTYIRVIANDFGEKLGCGGYLSKLRRTAIGEFNVEDALTTQELKEKFCVES